jgi:glyoxylase-like metal-dependent hydrolase (beta-lactamase superfamily II)
MMRLYAEGEQMTRTRGLVLAAALALVTTGPFAHAQGGGPAAPRSAVEIAPGISLVPGAFSPGTQPDGNSIILRAPGGLIVVDTGRHPDHARRIIDVAKAARQPVAAIVNTHWHLDHVGGNVLLRDEFPGVRVYASGAIREARTGFLAAYHKQLEGALAAPATDPASREAFQAELKLIDQGAKLEPDEVVAAAGRRTIAGLPLDVGLETHAVTAADVWLFEPRSRVLVAGDLVTLPAPFLDTACPARWKDSLDRLAKVEFRLLVPGHGGPMSRAEFEAYRTAFGRLLACGASGDRAKDECVSGWLKDVGSLVPEKDHGFTRSLMDYYVGVLRQDPARTAALCGG